MISRRFLKNRKIKTLIITNFGIRNSQIRKILREFNLKKITSFRLGQQKANSYSSFINFIFGLNSWTEYLL